DIPCQLGGGIRSLETIEDYLNLGLERVILGTLAVEQEELVAEAARRFPGRICVGIDARRGKVSTRGWAEETELEALDLALKMQDFGVAAIIYTDIMRDGMQTGVNLEDTGRLAESLEIPVIASGGIASLDDLEQLLTIESKGVTGAITGRALYEGTLDLREAMKLVDNV
ncbi:MAG: tRNA-dihydrouridine synthase, partial [Deltaproteobacteria bacterium]|nr:tRNA-dihydrouridine synthase [Candidatus Tharpellaceae bacterium]